MAKRKRKPAPQIMPQIGMPGSPEGNIGQAMTVAMLAAAQDGCECRACRALQTVVDGMFDHFMPEEEPSG